MSFLGSNVFERHGSDTMARSTFYFLIGTILTYAFGVTYAISEMYANWRPGTFEFFAVGLGIPIIGIIMGASKNPLLSFVGFNMVVIPFGMILGPTVQHFELTQPGVVSQAAFLTACTTAIMTASGFMYPAFYESIGGTLFAVLLALLGVMIGSMFIPALDGTYIHYAAVALFSLYVGYDMYRASNIPATLDNAIDVCTALYLDVINLFLHYLGIREN